MSRYAILGAVLALGIYAGTLLKHETSPIAVTSAPQIAAALHHGGVTATPVQRWYRGYRPYGTYRYGYGYYRPYYGYYRPYSSYYYPYYYGSPSYNYYSPYYYGGSYYTARPYSYYGPSYYWWW